MFPENFRKMKRDHCNWQFPVMSCILCVLPRKLASLFVVSQVNKPEMYKVYLIVRRVYKFPNATRGKQSLKK
jgi:hypothetical protein